MFMGLWARELFKIKLYIQSLLKLFLFLKNLIHRIARGGNIENTIDFYILCVEKKTSR